MPAPRTSRRSTAGQCPAAWLGRWTSSIDDIDAIVPEWFSPLAVLLADESALMFGLPGVPHPQGEADPRAVAIDKLRLTTYGRPTYERLKQEYF
jgi:hypothetical protein